MRKPFLTKVQEQALATRWRDHGDIKALHDLIEAHQPLVMSMASKYARAAIPMEDLVQEGSIGLLHAAKKFEPEQGFRFSTYAQWWVRAQLQDAVFRGSTNVMPPLHRDSKRAFMRGHKPIQEVSIDAPMSEDGATFADILPCQEPLPDEIAESSIDGERRSAWLRSALGRLNAREKTIIEARYLMEEGSTLDVLGSLLGISKERVRQLEQRALGRLRTLCVQEEMA